MSTTSIAKTESAASGEPVRGDRRAWLKGLGAVAALGMFGSTGNASAAVGEPKADLAKAAADCLHSCNVCMGHGIMLFKGGDLEMATCIEGLAEMIPVAQALHALGGLGSSHLKALAPACAAICEAAERECRKHAAKHAQCRDCADACARLLAQLKKA